MPNQSFLLAIGQEFLRVLNPLREGLDSAQDFSDLLLRLGWNVHPGAFDISEVRKVLGITGVFDDIDVLLDQVYDADVTTLKSLAPKITQKLNTIITKIRSLSTASLDSLPAPFNRQAFWEEFPTALLDDLVFRYLQFYRPQIFGPLLILGILQEEGVDVGTAPGRKNYIKRRVNWSLVKDLVRPSVSISQVYRWGSETFNAGLLLERIGRLFKAYGRLSYEHDPDTTLLDAYYDSNNPARRNVRELRLPLFFVLDSARQPHNFGLSILPIPTQEGTGNPVGIAILPWIEGTLPSLSFGRYSFTLRGGFQIDRGIRLNLRPTGVDVSLSNIASSKLDAEFGFHYKPDRSLILIGSTDSSRIKVADFQAEIWLRGDAVSPECIIEFGTNRTTVIIGLADADSFMGSMLGTDSLMIEFDGRIVWSSKTGFHFHGSGSLELVVPINRSIGIAEIHNFAIGIQPSNGGLALVPAVTGRAKLGPLFISVDRLGIKLVLIPVKSGQPPGVFGDLDLDFGFKPPDGAGMVIDSPAIVGGGYLLFDSKNEQYAGILQLEIKGGISLKAIGLLNTRLPDGSKGFSLLVIITAEFPPIVLGFGFTLNGVGGLLGVNRTMVLEVLRAGVKNRTLDSIMFPQDPVKNAQKIISDLQSVFPPVSGRFVFGPMAILAWGKPATILTIELGIVLELPSPVRLAIMGQLTMVLPTIEVEEKLRVAVLRMDVLGTIDFDKGDAAIDATIYDSRVAAFTITGDMAMRLNWGASPAFALSAGGFNPRFQPPPSFPSLGRMAIALATGDNPRLRLEAYLALTTNTLQFGARLDLYAEQTFDIAGFRNTFSAAANLSFDALVNFQPFSFLVDIDGQAAFKHNGNLLLPVSLHLTLSGPQPWRAVGEVTFDFVGKRQIPINLMIGEEPAQVLPPPGDPLGELKKALKDPRNWSAQLPSDGHTLVTLRKIEVTKELLVHPFGELTVRQKVVPLEVAISRFGSTTPADKGPFQITSIRFGTQTTEQAREEARDHFAPGQFFDLSDDEKLSLPAFQPLPSGCTRIGTEEISFSSVQIGASFQYDTVVIDNKEELKFRKGKGFEYAMANEVLVAVAALGAAGQSAMRSTGSAKFAGSGEQRVKFKDPEYTVASKDELAREATFESYVEAEAARRQKGAASVNYQTVGRHEVV